MINKVYEKIKNFIKENKTFLVFLLVFTIICYFPLPYFIYAPGGLVDVKERFDVEDSYPTSGSFQMAFVSEYHANLPVLLFAWIHPDWDIEKKEEVVAENESVEESMIRNKLLLEEANQDAVINAFRYAKKDYQIKKEELYVTYVDKMAKTDLKINDQIIRIDGKKVMSKEQLQNDLRRKEIGSVVVFDIIRNGKKETATGKLLSVDGVPKVGIMLTSKRTLETDPKVTFHFKESESGPSGGLMMSLAIYNSLVEEDITKGKKIAGTGTIDASGRVGEIGGIEYKIMGAEKEGASIFFAPAGKNYQEAKKIVKKKHYKIQVKEVKNFEDALKILKQ